MKHPDRYTTTRFSVQSDEYISNSYVCILADGTPFVVRLFYVIVPTKQDEMYTALYI